MKFLNPQALLLGLIAIPILLMYMLRLRRRAVTVSSTMLWEMLLRDMQANTPWQRLKRNLLLFIQLLILASLVLALSRPVLPVPGITEGSVIVLLDASASMNAVDVSPSRFEAARIFTRSLISNLSNGNSMTLILVSEQPILLASGESDKAHLLAVLDTASVTQGEADWDAALALAAGVHSATMGSGKPSQSTIILSDGGLPPTQLIALPGKVSYLPFGVSSANLAISALSARSTGSAVQLFASLANYSTLDSTAILSIYIAGSLSSAQQVSVPAQGTYTLILDGLPLAQGVYSARLSQVTYTDGSGDMLPLDDLAFTVFTPTRVGQTLLVTPGNIFLEQVLSILPNITPFRLVVEDPLDFDLPPEPFDLIVLDGVFPATQDLPDGNLLLINPPSNPLITVTGAYPVSAELISKPGALMEGVDVDTIHIAQASQVELPVWAEAQLYTGQGPLLFSGETQGRRIAVLCFDLHASDLPLQVAFPILFANLTAYLVPPRLLVAPDSLSPGQSLSITPSSQTTEVNIITPSGSTIPIVVGGADSVFTQTSEIGLYAIEAQTIQGMEVTHFPVNLFSPLESAIQPADTLHIGSTTISTVAPDEVALKELWPWLAGLALALLLLEWWLYHGRLRLPQPHRAAG